MRSNGQKGSSLTAALAFGLLLVSLTVLLGVKDIQAQIPRPDRQRSANKSETARLQPFHHRNMIEVSRSNLFTDFSDTINSTVSSGTIFNSSATGASGGYFHLGTSATDAYWGAASSSGGSPFGTIANSAIYFGNRDNVPLQFLTASAARMTISGDGNVGIGTASPAQKLDVAGYIRGSNAAANGIVLGSGSSPINQAVVFPNGYALYDTGADIRFQNSSGSSLLTMQANGNVGIGTNSPGYKLDVNGEINATAINVGAIKANNQLALMPWFNLGTAPQGPWVPGYMKLVTPIVHTENNMFSIKIKGYRYGTAGTPVEIRCGGYAWSGSTLISANCFTEGTSDPVGIGVENNKIIITIGSGAGTWYYDHFTAEYTGDIAKNPNDFSWQFVYNTAPATTNTNNVVVNDSAGTITTTGNVGIGTASPASRLEVASGNSDPFFFNGNYNKFRATSGWTYLESYHGAEVVIDNSGNYSDRTFTISKGASRINGGSPEALLTVQENGNVGIGVTSPAQKLHLGGNLLINQTNQLIFDQSYGVHGNLSVTADTGDSMPRLRYEGYYGHRFLTSGGEVMRITQGGRVGIGTGIPGYQLDVQGGSINASGGLCINGSCKTDWSQLGQWANGSNSISYTGGSVGIGTSPSGNYQFEVAGYGQAGTGAKIGVMAIARSGGDYDSIGYNFRPTSTGGAYNYDVQDFSSRLEFTLGGFKFKTAPGGNAGQPINYSDAVTIKQDGNVGIGMTNPAYKLDVYGPSGNYPGRVASPDGYLLFGPANGSWSHFSTDRPRFYFNTGITVDTGNVGSYAQDLNLQTSGTSRLTISNSTGNVAIGTAPTGNKLEVYGNTNVTGNITATGSIAAKYQDVAEWVPAAEQLSAGTVVVLDSTKSNQVTSSSVSYDTRVAGVVSEQPGLALGEKSEGKVLVATTGRVRVKVDATKGPIHIGDLLVTSDVPGVAMKSEPVEFAGRKMHMPGTLIGKALEPLEKGKGEILVLLSLQ
jgi:hypothetical protein